jgi:hypothetical protein
LQFFLHSSASLEISRYINGLNNKKDQDSSLAGSLTVSLGVGREIAPIHSLGFRHTQQSAEGHAAACGVGMSAR